MRRVMLRGAGWILASLLLAGRGAEAAVLLEEHFEGLAAQLAGPARAPAKGVVTPQAVADEAPAQLPEHMLGTKVQPLAVGDAAEAAGEPGGGAPMGGATSLPGKAVKTAHGIGWTSGLPESEAEERNAKGAYLKYSAAKAVRAARGSIELDLVRKSHGQEALFDLTDAHGQQIFWMSVDWGENILRWAGPGEYWYTVKEMPVLPGSRYRTRWRDRDISLGGLVAQGGEAHFVINWGPADADCTIFLNGHRLDVEVGRPFALPVAIAQAKWLVLGGRPEANWQLSEFSLSSAIEYVRTYDAPQDGARLYHDPLRYYDKAHGTPVVKSLDQNYRRLSGFSGKLASGDKLTVEMQGTPGVEGTFDIARLPNDYGEIPLDWKGYGVYLEQKTFFEKDEVNLRDVDEYRVYAAEEPFAEIAAEAVPAATLRVNEQSYMLTHLKPRQPYYVAVMAAMRDGTHRPIIWPRAGIAMQEVAQGRYEGTFTVGYQDAFAQAVVVGHLARGKLTTTQVDTQTLVIDPALNVSVVTDPSELKADEQSTAKVTVTVTDANGKAMSGHKIRFVLATTSQYTGVVGGGKFKDVVGGSLKEDFLGETDLFGRVTASYVAGFAAKTALVVARDMASNSTGVGVVKTYIQATAELQLEPVQPLTAAAEGYEIQLTTSDQWLTADGRSQARITALVTLHGKPVEGHRVGFEVSSGSGSIRAVRDTTDRNGEARAVYTAGTKIGMVLITGTDLTVGISSAIQIELRSDAPAKIKLRIKPEKLPADGHSVAELQVQVTDIHDNPNDGAVIEYRLAAGSGRLRELRGTTDRNGEHTEQFIAGRTPGKVSIELTVRSYVPTAEELVKARDLALAVPDYNFF